MQIKYQKETENDNDIFWYDNRRWGLIRKRYNLVFKLLLEVCQKHIGIYISSDIKSIDDVERSPGEFKFLFTWDLEELNVLLTPERIREATYDHRI